MEDRQIDRKILSVTFLCDEEGKCDVDLQEYSKRKLCMHTAIQISDLLAGCLFVSATTFRLMIPLSETGKGRGRRCAACINQTGDRNVARSFIPELLHQSERQWIR